MNNQNNKLSLDNAHQSAKNIIETSGYSACYFCRSTLRSGKLKIEPIFADKFLCKLCYSKLYPIHLKFIEIEKKLSKFGIK
jgi:hypothetical protein